MEDTQRAFIPAAGRDWRLPLYDPLVRLIGGDRARRVLIEAGHVEQGHRVLDLGCGTGSLAIDIARAQPTAEVVGLDPDPRALSVARRKAAAASLSIHFDRGFAGALPYSERAFDRVFSSFVLHHLRGDEKAEMLREARRVLRPDGRLYLLDFSGPDPDVQGMLARWLRSRPLLVDNAVEPVVARMREAGFEGARRIGAGPLVFGLAEYSCFEATSPGADGDAP